LTLPIANCRLPIADYRFKAAGGGLGKIDDWQLAIGNELMLRFRPFLYGLVQ